MGDTGKRKCTTDGNFMCQETKAVQQLRGGRLMDKLSKNVYILFALLAAALYSLNAPFSKLLLQRIPPTMMAAFLYLGAGIGMLLVGCIRKAAGRTGRDQPLTRGQLPFISGMIILDIAAPIFLMLGLQLTTAANASLLNNFEIVATAVIALAVFKERITGRLWGAVSLITLSSMILSLQDGGSFRFSSGSLLVLAACVCWGLENNCTRMLSGKDPMEVVILKGFGSGLGSLAIALATGEKIPRFDHLGITMLLGFVSYGLSIFFYVYAQRGLGAARTSAYYAAGPFIGVALSFVIFRKMPGTVFFAALALMAVGAYLASTEGRRHTARLSSGAAAGESAYKG